MNKFIQKSTILYGLFVFMLPYMVHPSHSIQQPSQQLHESDARVLVWEKRNSLINGYCRQYKVPISLLPLIRNLLYGNKRKESMAYLAGEDLSGIDFTGCKFIGINLTNTNLQGAILTNTTCKYFQKFNSNLRNKRGNCVNDFYFYIFSLFSGISSCYEKYIKDHDSKARLLHIASGFAQLPFYDGKELNIKFQYWSWQLKLFNEKVKQQTGSSRKNKNRNRLLLKLYRQLENEFEWYSWETTYLQGKVGLNSKKENINFDEYLKHFKRGVNCWHSNEDIELCKKYYVNSIRKSIESLKNAYPKIKSKELQQIACEIAEALSKSSQYPKKAFITHYLDCQNRLISLNEMAVKKLNNQEKGWRIYYKGIPSHGVQWN